MKGEFHDTTDVKHNGRFDIELLQGLGRVPLNGSNLPFYDFMQRDSRSKENLPQTFAWYQLFFFFFLPSSPNPHSFDIKRLLSNLQDDIVFLPPSLPKEVSHYFFVFIYIFLFQIYFKNHTISFANLPWPHLQLKPNQ